MGNNIEYDLIVIGGGPGGYVAAIRASQLGMKTALIEAKHLGGICLNWGCIPTKALLKSSELFRNIKKADDFGIKVNDFEPDIKKMVERSRAVAKQLSGGIGHLLKKNKVDVIEGWGKIAGKNKVSIENNGKVEKEITTKHIILATGARQRVLPGLEPDGNLIWTSSHAMVQEEIPSSLLVVGSGAIGCEFASFYNDIGCKVTIVEIADRILPIEDEEISQIARKQFEKQGINIITSASVSEIQKNKNSITASIKKQDGSIDQVEFSRALVAVGIVGNVENIGLKNTSVKTEKNQVITDAWKETDEKGVYAIGDIAGAPWLAHKASHEAVICVEKIAGLDNVHPLDKKGIAGCTYTHPQIASFGYTEKQAIDEGYEIKIGRFPYIANGKAIAIGETEGIVKTVFDAKTGELLGAHMIGADVTEMIQGYVVAKSLETTESELMHTVFPHPTLSEMMHESVLDAYDRALHY